MRALILASIAAAGILITAAHVAAQDVGTLESKISGAREEARGLAAELDSKSSALAQARERADAAEVRESELSTTLAQGERRSAELERRLAEAESRLSDAQRRLRGAIDVLERRLVAIYKGEVPDATTLILEADGFDDLVTRAEYLERIEDADAKLVARVRDLRDQVQRELSSVRDAREKQEAFNSKLRAAEAQIAAARADAESEAAALAAARSAQTESLEGLRSRIGDWTKQVQEAQSVSESEAQQQVSEWVGDWAIPTAIVMCESGGNFGALNPSSGAGGAYQILPSTWKAYGGKGLPHEASPAEQHRIAAQIWADSGGSAWVCAG